jgi:hypothetical protein
MGPKGNLRVYPSKWEQEKLREFVIGLHKAGKSYGYICIEAEKLFKRRIPKPTVQSIVKNFKDRSSMAEKPKKGRNRIYTAQYACLGFVWFTLFQCLATEGV